MPGRGAKILHVGAPVEPGSPPVGPAAAFPDVVVGELVPLALDGELIETVLAGDGVGPFVGAAVAVPKSLFKG